MYIQRDATLHSLFYLETALHVSGGTTTHHQERKQLYLQHLVFVTPLLLPAAIAACNSNGVTNSVDTVVCAPDDGWWYHPKHVRAVSKQNELCNVASRWICVRILLRCTDPWALNVHKNVILSSHPTKPVPIQSLYTFLIFVLCMLHVRYSFLSIWQWWAWSGYKWWSLLLLL